MPKILSPCREDWTSLRRFTSLKEAYPGLTSCTLSEAPYSRLMSLPSIPLTTMIKDLKSIAPPYQQGKFSLDAVQLDKRSISCHASQLTSHIQESLLSHWEIQLDSKSLVEQVEVLK